MTKKTPSVSPGKILLIILLAIFLAEAFLMVVFHLADFKNSPMMILTDSLFLSILLIPILYLFAYKPLVKSNLELQTALDEIKTLKGIIPICSYCKKIRDDEEIWQQIEDYIVEHSDAQFSHGMCPDCYDEQIAEVHKMRKGQQRRAGDKTHLP